MLDVKAPVFSSRPSTTIEIPQKGNTQIKSIKLRKNSLTLTCLKPTEMPTGLSDMTKSYIPDFGYDNQIDFDRKNGWNLLVDFISKFPKREKTANLIYRMNRLKEILTSSMSF